MEPVKAKPHEILYSSAEGNSGIWRNLINVVIILENGHRFKDDPWYGQMLSRMWSGDLTQEDRERINTRVIRKKNSNNNDGIELPKSFPEGFDVCYACPTNKERNAITAGIFRDHINLSHPLFDSSDDPPDHTIMIEANIQSSIKKKNNKNSQIGIN